MTIVDRKGTATIYINPAAGATFEAPSSFEAGTPVLTASMRHQVILDTANGNTIFMTFDLTVISAETFTVGDKKHQLGRPGQKMTWTNYGRPNTSAMQPGQFVFAGVAVSHDPAPPGLRVNSAASSSSSSIQPNLEDVSDPRSQKATSPNLTNGPLLATVNHQETMAVVEPDMSDPSTLYLAIAE